MTFSRASRSSRRPEVPSRQPGAPLPWETVFFDLDGTLADTIPLIIASYRHAFREVMGVEVEESAARAWIGRPLLPALLEESPEHGHELDRVYREWNLANTARLIRAYPGIQGLLEGLEAAGARTAVVTSKRRETALVALEHVGIGGRIEVVAGLEDTTEHKPHPAPLLHGARAVGVEPSACVYVGDATVDILAARAAGMAAVAVTWGAGTSAELVAVEPDRICETVEELTDLLMPAV
ncbi:MAG: HAD family hydrolase [Dermatophilaceae bacterium]|nr:HAD-IA family hydrolase [Intrasporangiaceae bacterium]